MALQNRKSYFHQGSESLKLVPDAERHSFVSVLLVLSFQNRTATEKRLQQYVVQTTSGVLRGILVSKYQ